MIRKILVAMMPAAALARRRGVRAAASPADPQWRDDHRGLGADQPDEPDDLQHDHHDHHHDDPGADDDAPRRTAALLVRRPVNGWGIEGGRRPEYVDVVEIAGNAVYVGGALHHTP